MAPGGQKVCATDAPGTDLGGGGTVSYRWPTITIILRDLEWVFVALLTGFRSAHAGIKEGGRYTASFGAKTATMCKVLHSLRS